MFLPTDFLSALFVSIKLSLELINYPDGKM
jgi:hypothetical protein